MNAPLLGVLCEMHTLRNLHIGGIRMTTIQWDRLRDAKGRSLKELAVHSVNLCATSIAALGQYTHLRALGLAGCTGVRKLLQFLLSAVCMYKHFLGTQAKIDSVLPSVRMSLQVHGEVFVSTSDPDWRVSDACLNIVESQPFHGISCKPVCTKISVINTLAGDLLI